MPRNGLIHRIKAILTITGVHGDRSRRPADPSCEEIDTESLFLRWKLQGGPLPKIFIGDLTEERSPGGTEHNAALRQLANRLVGILHGCLKTRTCYDEATAWSHHLEKAAA
jgi:hypothetical protein